MEGYQVTGKRLLSTCYERKVGNGEGKGQYSRGDDEEYSCADVSVQAQGILGEQSMITRLYSNGGTSLNLFSHKDISIQFDQLPPDHHDKSCNMSHH